MMKQKKNILRAWPWLLMQAALFTWLLPQQALADDTYVESVGNYSIMLTGSNVVTIEAPACDFKGTDTWVSDGNVYVEWKDGSTTKKERVLYWAGKDVPWDGWSNSDTKEPFYFKTETDGYLEIKPGPSASTFKLTKGDNQVTKDIYRTGETIFEFSADWIVPYSLLGKELTFTWKVERNISGAGAKKTLSISSTTIKMPEAEEVAVPVTSYPMLNPNSKGMIEVPWFLAAKEITKLNYSYTDANGKYVEKDLPTQVNNGTIQLKANEPHRNFRMTASYYQEGAKGKYHIENVKTEAQNLSMIHAPQALNARFLGGTKAKVALEWSVPYLEDEDLTPTDFFEIQRSLTGKEEDFVTIHQEFYSKNDNKSSYTFTDSTLINDVTADMLTDGGTLANLTYRVRRTITNDWGWDHNCAATTKCVLDRLHLLRISDYTAKWEDEKAYSVRVTWNYANEVNAVWDDRAQMKMCIISRNRDGAIVDSMVYVLDQNDRGQRYKIVNLTRSCVTYDINMYVERNESPFNDIDQTKDFFFPIRNANDWAAFRDKVEAAKGEYDVNARLYADVNAGSIMVGWTEGTPYRGTFDGNGHTLTFNVGDHNRQYVAPFVYVSGNATIKNLHTAGTITSSQKNIGGLVGRVMANTKLAVENCRVSVTLNSTVNGDATNGGIVSHVASESASVNITNCKFDGAFDGENCSHNGGFVGWSAANSSVTISNSLFAPDHINTSGSNCETWTRNSAGINLSVINSHATREYSTYIVIRNASDWHTFAVLVNNAQNQSGVDARLEADITTSEHVGVTEGAAYRGTFDGNGHTLTFNKSGFTENYVAPFRYVGNATIKNLHTAGSIQSSGTYATGLVAALINNTTVTIENCHSSVNLNCTGSGDKTLSGFVGRLQDCTLTIRNCKFDGSFEGANSWGHAGFVSWAAPNTNVTIENCLFDPKHISTKLESCETWARKDGASSAKVTVTNSEAITHYSPSKIIIRSADDWDKFVQLVKDAKNSYWVDAILQADITVSKSVGSDDAPWRGTLHGNGHTININIESGSYSYAALFPKVWVVNITDLHVTGKVNGGMHSAGLIGGVYGTPTITLNRVWVSVEVNCSSTHAGGFFGHSDNATVNMTDCLFDGKVNTNNADNSYVGEIIGWSENGNWSLQRVYDNGWPKAHWMFYCNRHEGAWSSWGTNSNSYTITRHGWGNVDQHDKTDQSEVVNLMNARQAGTWQLVNGNAVPVMQTTEKNLTAAEQQVEALGKEYWEVVDGKAVPKMESAPVVSEASLDDLLAKLGTGWVKEGETINPVTTMYDEPNYTPTPKPTLPDFYHKNTGTIDKELLVTTRQSSVLLAWNTDGSPIDFFTVYRRVKDAGDAWKEVATNLDQMSYEDKSVSPLATYEYKVVAVNQCEGRDSTETQVKQGECKHTGRLEGYVRFNDGTGAPDINVDIYYVYKEGDEEKKKFAKKVITDESGYFEADELSYENKTSAGYKVVPVSREGIRFEVEDYQVTFNAHSNNEEVHEFIITNGKRFSGYVMYDGTSIPVKGVNFLVNGKKIHNNKGDVVESDYDGSFSFRLVSGDNTIQAVMDNHVFTNEGWYKNSDKQHITSDVAGIYFYDATKVKLTGRIVGGDEQGKKPLGNNLSKNNLGDSLQIVLTLEGDNTSWLVYDNLNPNKTQREEVFKHKRGGDKHYTTVKTQRKRMEVTPDLKTGEYELMLPPVRWKVQQVYCKGYPTLFQEGQVSEVIDLTDCLISRDTTYAGTYKDVDSITVSKPSLTYHAIYNRIYHAPVEVTYKQVGYDTFDYFGDKTYVCSELTGKVTQVPLAFPNPADTTQAVYSFGHPVFSMERKYFIQVQVAEFYRYNNDARFKPDMVCLGGGTAYMQNGMKAGAYKEPLPLDSLGRATFTLKADQMTTLLTGENALKTVSFTVERDSTFFEAKPLQGYVLNMFPVGNAMNLLNDGQPILFDVLRDPPGAYSSNTLAKGATLNYSYVMNLSITAGPYITLKGGSNLQTVSATVAAPQGVGTAVGPISLSDNYETDIDMLMYTANGTKAFSYSMVVGNNISTSGDPSMVGADADLYIGAVQNVSVMPMSTIRAVTKQMYNQMMARQGLGAMTSEVGKYDEYGTVVKIAEGEVLTIDKKTKVVTRDTIYLIRDVALGYGPKVQSQFVYSQKQLLTQIIPDKAKEIVDLMFLGTKDEAQAIANRTGRPVYLSLRLPTDSTFAVANKEIPGHKYNTTIDKPEEGINYLVVLPKGKTESDFYDDVAEKYQVIKAWLDMIARNEKEKMEASDLLVNYDIAGAQGVNYSETFDSNFSNTFAHHFPMGIEVDYFGVGAGVSNAASAASIGLSIASAIGLSLKQMKTWSMPSAELALLDDENGMQSKVTFAGKLLQWSLFPVAVYNTLGSNAETKGYNRTETFTIAASASSRLSVDVYRAQMPMVSSQNVSIDNIFTNDNFANLSREVYKQVEKDLKSSGIKGPRSFIFRTRGGATADPWEDQRVTKIYRPGSVLDTRTLKICNPKIRLDKQSVSGVSVDDAAVFTVYISNESEKPEATDGLTVLQLFSADQANPQGAKISVNGQQLTTAGMTVSVVPGIETALTMEVRAGQGFDYEGLTLGVMSPSDAEHAVELVQFDVHFLREAGKVNIAVPGDKWVLNTNAQKDSKRGWYIPVTINGFDRHQHNFDHIEFQYKESQRGDDSWTNLCSFYADEKLMANANGVRKLIPENGNIVTEFYGEGWTMEREYDLRAVLFCRNGSDFLTTASPVIHGIKDTRRPQLFGTPEPKSGLLTQNDNIVFNFSEDIEYNYLSAITNFEVKGEVNNDNVSENVSVQFAGKASVETEAKRNFSGKNVTIDLMVKPAETGHEMPIFSHGTNGEKLQLWLTEDFKLKAVVGGQVFTSNDAIGKNAFRQVALVLNQTDSLLTFYNGGVQMGSHKLKTLYNGTGPLIFGRTNETDRNQSHYYEGRMMEARLWYSAMDGGLIGTTYGHRRLTGYEKDLVDYYPMNEGSGDYVNDHTQGANAKLMGAGWAIPRGLSLSLKKEDKGLLLDKNALNRTAEHDYTLMFWFQTDADGRGALLSNGRGLKEDNGALNLFHIGFEGDKLMYRSNGYAEEVPGNWSDGKWHNFAMTVNRAHNVVNIYMDKELKTTFEADSLGGISGGYPLIGATRYDVVKDNGDVEVVDGDDALTGNVDELLFFAQALPETLIKTYTTKSPNGDEAGLMTYLAFDRQERQKDNSIELVPYAYSKKLYLDDKGEPRYQLDPLTKEPTDVLVRDYLFVDNEADILKRFDAESAAPVVPYEEVTNLKFGFIGRGNQLLVDLDEPAAKLHHRNIHVTVRDIEDKNGNTMASPQTACYYVLNNSLEWLVNKLDVTVKYGSGESTELTFYNGSSSAHTYKIENYPKWLTLNKSTDAIAPLATDYVTATVSKDLNVGTYNEILYLTDEDGITEPFYFNLTVEGEQPVWAQDIDGSLLQNSMSISGQVYLFGELDTDARDIVGAFDNENVCHGYANISHDAQGGETGLFLTVYDNQDNGRPLSFRLWQYNTGREIVLKTTPAITFEKDAILGTDTPVRFDGGKDFVQYFNLQEGWNWVSFNVSSKDEKKMNTLLTSVPWQHGDILIEMGTGLTLNFKDDKWYASDDPKDVPISSKTAYAINVHKPCRIPVAGTVIKDKDERTIDLKQGWNAIGYTPVVNLPVETALSDYYDLAEPGDVIKSHTEFAYFTKTGNIGRWRGNLQYMKPGEGYLLLHKGAAETSFTYPYYEPGSIFLDSQAQGAKRSAARSRSTMSVSAVVEGFEPEDGDILVAYSNGEEVGLAPLSSPEGDTAEAESKISFLSIGSTEAPSGAVGGAPIWFAIERDGEIVAATDEIMTFETNAVIGSPDEPTAINFVHADNSGANGKWYTIGGLQLQQKPTHKGVYIFNGKKVMVK